jgi:hypothetical protein
MTATMPAHQREKHCRHCGQDFSSRRKRAQHECPDQRAAERAQGLRWSTEPVESYLVAKLGIYDRQTNPIGYCAEAVERLTGMKANTWKRIVAEGRDLTDAQADQLATALGVPPVSLWPNWYLALDITDEDLDWLDAWSRGAA